jgi:hypothetical protein
MLSVSKKSRIAFQINFVTFLSNYYPWYFDRAVVFQRLINQSFYQEILLLQKFDDIGGKVLKPKKVQPPTSKK